MKRLFFAALFAVALLCACGDAGRGVATHISGRFVGSNVDTVYLERVSDTFAAPERIGAQSLADNGAFSFEFDVEKSLSPRFYKLTFSGNTRPVTLVVKAGDKIELESAGDIFINYRAEEVQTLKRALLLAHTFAIELSLFETENTTFLSSSTCE